MMGQYFNGSVVALQTRVLRFAPAGARDWVNAARTRFADALPAGGSGSARATRRTFATGIHALRSLDGALAFAILAALGLQRLLVGTGDPSLEAC